MKEFKYTLLFFFMFLYQAQAQQKNAVYVGGGDNFILYDYRTLNINYELNLNHKDEARIFDYYALKTGLGVVESSHGIGFSFELGMVALIGGNAHNLELNLGAFTVYDSAGYMSDLERTDLMGETMPKRAEYFIPIPSGSVGYRFQKPEGGLMFRIGVGFPEVVYLGVGYYY